MMNSQPLFLPLVDDCLVKPYEEAAAVLREYAPTPSEFDLDLAVVWITGEQTRRVVMRWDVGQHSGLLTTL